MAKNSKATGNNYEREFSYKLSEWITGEKDSDICWRDVSSGSRYTKRKKENKETARKADIICTDLKYQYWFDLFYVDTKSYKEFNWCFINIKNQKSNKILQQWIKTVDESPVNMIPFMPVKIRDSKTPDFVILPKYLYLVDYLPYLYIELRNKYSCYLVLQENLFQLEKAINLYERNKHYVIKKV